LKSNGKIAFSKKIIDVAVLNQQLEKLCGLFTRPPCGFFPALSFRFEKAMVITDFAI